MLVMLAKFLASRKFNDPGRLNDGVLVRLNASARISNCRCPTKDPRKVSLWLGHAHMQTTEMYTRADPSVKLEALEAMIAPKLRPGRFRATDKLIASLTSQSVMRSTTRSI
jgi:hypothetical protein